jgi:hypothetical protein
MDEDIPPPSRGVMLRSPVGYVMDTPWSRARIAEGNPPLS